jgi:hypothetical protein
MSGRIARVLPQGARFLYTYDFGSSTRLVGRVVGTLPRPKGAAQIRVVARNDPPARSCARCGAPATEVCALCYQYRDSDCWWCEQCAPGHQCIDPGGAYFLPVVNSPRVGVCGYSGGVG